VQLLLLLLKIEKKADDLCEFELSQNNPFNHFETARVRVTKAFLHKNTVFV